MERFLSRPPRRIALLAAAGLDPTRVERWMEEGRLPHLARIASAGGYHRVATSTPAGGASAWASLLTGARAPLHGVFDTVLRDPATGAVRPGEPGRESEAIGSLSFLAALDAHDLQTVSVGVPLGLLPRRKRGWAVGRTAWPDGPDDPPRGVWFDSERKEARRDSSGIVTLPLRFEGDVATAHFPGPAGSAVPLRFLRGGQGTGLAVVVGRQVFSIAEGEWSPWVAVRFPVTRWKQRDGLLRFYARALGPRIAIYALRPCADPARPAYALSRPASYSVDLASRFGPWGFPELHDDPLGVDERRFTEAAVLEQFRSGIEETERVLRHEIARREFDFLVVNADLTDRPAHFLHGPPPSAGAGKEAPASSSLLEVYRRLDGVVGGALDELDDRDALFVVSLHGQSPIHGLVHLNTWLEQEGFLVRGDGGAEGAAARIPFRPDSTRAYALGATSIYLHRRGRESGGIVGGGAEAEALGREIAARLAELRDPSTGGRVVRWARLREEAFPGADPSVAPDVVVLLEPGYRASWETERGGFGAVAVEPYRGGWGADHVSVDPAEVPGFFLSTLPLSPLESPTLEDLAPTILSCFGVLPPSSMSGKPMAFRGRTRSTTVST